MAVASKPRRKSGSVQRPSTLQLRWTSEELSDHMDREDFAKDLRRGVDTPSFIACWQSYSILATIEIHYYRCTYIYIISYNHIYIIHYYRQ